MDGTILGQGTFNSFYTGANPNPGNAEVQAGNQVIIPIPSAADWVRVVNFTKSGADGDDTAYFQGTANAVIGTEFYWQRGMAPGTATVNYYENGSTAVYGDTLLTGGFTIYDPSGLQTGSQPLLGNPVATTATTNAVRPVVSTASTAGLTVGSVVRLTSTAQTDVNGVDFVVGAVVANTSFTLLTATNPLANVPGVVGGDGFYQIVYNPPLYYPARKAIVEITQATNAQVSTSIEHSLTTGQSIRFKIPATSGMVQLNPTPQNNYMYSTVLSVIDPYNFTIDTNTTSFTAFTWPTVAQEPTSVPTYEPIGQNTATTNNPPLGLNIITQPLYQGLPIYATNNGVFADATVNTGYYGMILGSGGDGSALTTPIIGPAGTVSFSAANVITAVDTVYWVSGKAGFGGL
jgi:hypothetical protein